MSNTNKVILVGRLGKDPEIRYTTEGTPVALFSLATTESYKDRSGNKQEKTEWHNIIAWRKLAEIAGEYLTKGKLVYVEGKIQSREYNGKDGVKRKIYEIVASEVKILSTGHGNGAQKGGAVRDHSAGNTHENDLPHEYGDDVPR